MNLVPLLLLGLLACVFAVRPNELVYPENCKDDDSCTYKVDWTVTKDQVKFTIVSKQPDTAWTGIGFAKEKPMEKAEFVYGYINSEGKGAAFDGFIEDPDSAPVKDPLQKLISSSVVYSNGHLTLNFVHHRVTNAPYEYSFRNTDCYYFLLPFEGGSIVDDHGIINKPYNTPKITDDKICFHEDGLTTLENPPDIVDVTTVLPETTTSYNFRCSIDCTTGTLTTSVSTPPLEVRSSSDCKTGKLTSSVSTASMEVRCSSDCNTGKLNSSVSTASMKVGCSSYCKTGTLTTSASTPPLEVRCSSDCKTDVCIALCKVGVEDGLYPHPTDCKMFVRCTGGQETFLTCLPEKPYYEPVIRDCTTQGYLSAERKKECNVS